MFYRNRLAPIVGFSVVVVVLAVFSRSASAGEIKEAPASSSGTATASEHGAWYSRAWKHADDTWRHGGWEVYVPVYTFHMPFAYTPSLLRSYNDYPAGLGIGRGHYNASGNYEGFFAMEFADSHALRLDSNLAPLEREFQDRPRADGIRDGAFRYPSLHAFPRRTASGVDRLSDGGLPDRVRAGRQERRQRHAVLAEMVLLLIAGEGP
jgi:hypothetical protein